MLDAEMLVLRRVRRQVQALLSGVKGRITTTDDHSEMNETSLSLTPLLPSLYSVNVARVWVRGHSEP